MPLETGTYISDLNASNPVGSTDKVQTLDDHVRLLKSTIKASFPGVTGAVTPTHTELNYVDGVTSAIQTQLDTKAAAAALNASNLTSGTVPDARFPATLPAASGVNLTALNGTNIASGTVADARLSSNIPQKDDSNDFTGVEQTIIGGNGAFGQWRLENSSGSARGTFTFSDAGSGFLENSVYLGSTAAISLHLLTNSAARMSIDSSGNYTFGAGTVTTSNAGANEVGFKGVPAVTNANDYTLLLSDAGALINCTASTAVVTIPANASVAFPIGTVITILGNAGDAGTTSIQITSDTLYLAGTGYATTGSRTLAYGGIASIVKITSTAWLISGTGLS